MGSSYKEENKVKEITENDWQSDIADAKIPVFVDFWAPWCGPCRMVGPAVDEIAKERKFDIKFVKVNLDENPSLAASQNIQSIPTLAIFKDGKVVRTTIGAQSKANIERFIAETIAKI